MSLLLHSVAKLIFFAILAVVVLTLLTWLTKKTGSDKITPSSEWPEDKATSVNRVSSIRDSNKKKEKKERRRAS
jgi:hypothetical protein